MFRRSDVRLCAYKLKGGNNAPEDKKWLVPEIEKIMLEEDTWESFAESWDVVVSRDKITRVATERDEIFINNTCVEIKTKISVGIPEEEVVASLSPRQLNIYSIVTANYLGDTVDWEAYNETWGVKLDLGSGRTEVYSKKTKKNTVDIAKVSTPTPLSQEVKQEAGSLDDLDEDLLAKIKNLLKNKE